MPPQYDSVFCESWSSPIAVWYTEVDSGEHGEFTRRA
jgi:hypothetical protein